MPSDHFTARDQALVPCMDVFVSEYEFLLVVDLPGVSEENLSITFEDEHLRILAMNEDGTERKYFRKLHVGKILTSEAIESDLSNGELRVYLPRPFKHVA